MKNYRFESRYGTFFIRFKKNRNKFQLFIDEQPLSEYLTAKDAAKAVADQETGYELWDSSGDPTNYPTSFEKWEIIE